VSKFIGQRNILSDKLGIRPVDTLCCSTAIMAFLVTSMEDNEKLKSIKIKPF
jgi:hypothetical protein